MKGLRASIYENKEFGNSSNKGISSKVKEVTVVGEGIPEIFQVNESAPAVKIIKRDIGGEYLHAEPVEGKDPNTVGWMAGGAFIYSSDSRFPSKYPIGLHDRQESEELNNILSR